jgi:hypothetical protein
MMIKQQPCQAKGSDNSNFDDSDNNNSISFLWVATFYLEPIKHYAELNMKCMM